MPLAPHASTTFAHDMVGGEARLKDADITAHEEGLPLLLDGMTSQLRPSVSGDKPIADKSGDGSDVALESLGDVHTLDDAQLRAQGHEVALRRSFSPLSALGLGFRYATSRVHMVPDRATNLQ